VCSRGGGRDRPEAACPPGSRAADGEAGGFNAVQKLLTNRDSQRLTATHTTHTCIRHIAERKTVASRSSVRVSESLSNRISAVTTF